MMDRIKGIVLVVVLLCAYIAVDHLGNRYYLNGEVIEATETGCLVTDEKGDPWYYEGEGFAVGDNVEMVMHTRETETNLDDAILKIRVVK